MSTKNINFFEISFKQPTVGAILLSILDKLIFLVVLLYKEQKRRLDFAHEIRFV